MLDERDLQAIAQLIDTKLDTKLQPINSRLDKLQENLEDLKEGQEEIRGALNSLLEWTDKASEAEKFPLPKVGT